MSIPKYILPYHFDDEGGEMTLELDVKRGDTILVTLNPNEDKHALLLLSNVKITDTKGKDKDGDYQPTKVLWFRTYDQREFPEAVVLNKLYINIQRTIFMEGKYKKSYKDLTMKFTPWSQARTGRHSHAPERAWPKNLQLEIINPKWVILESARLKLALAKIENDGLNTDLISLIARYIEGTVKDRLLR